MAPRGRFAFRQVSQITCSRQGREPLALRFLTGGAFGAVAPSVLFPVVRGNKQVPGTLAGDGADMRPTQTLLERADELRASITLCVKRHAGEPSRLVNLRQAGDPPVHFLA